MKVVCLGGGKGLSSAVKAWRKLGAEITAIVATTDNGGCSGRLRQEGSPVPWGDLRKAIVALCSCESHLLNTLSHRYSELGQLSGHCVGNLMLEALYQQTGSVTAALDALTNELNCCGTVLPMCEESLELTAILPSGQKISGETTIGALYELPLQVSLSRHADAPKKCIEAIEQADLICIGPGSLITSVLPVLLTPNIRNALVNCSADKLFIHNIDEEQGPARQLNKQVITHWLKQQCDCELRNELLPDALFLDGKRFELPDPLKAVAGNQECAHDVDALATAFAFVKCVAFNSRKLAHEHRRQSHLRVAF